MCRSKHPHAASSLSSTAKICCIKPCVRVRRCLGELLAYRCPIGHMACESIEYNESPSPYSFSSLVCHSKWHRSILHVQIISLPRIRYTDTGSFSYAPLLTTLSQMTSPIYIAFLFLLLTSLYTLVRRAQFGSEHGTTRRKHGCRVYGFVNGPVNKSIDVICG